MRVLTKPISAGTAIVVAVLVCAGVIWQATRTSEASNPRRAAAFGMFGVTANQIARLNVTNACNPVDPCRTRTLRLSFIDANGSSCGGVDCAPMQTTVTLEPGRSAFFDIQGALLTGSRAQMRALVEESGSPNSSPGSIIPTLEVIDAATGVTTFHISSYMSVNGCGGSNPFF